MTTAAILLVGAELLRGDVVDQNGPALLTALRGHGVAVRELRLVGDIVDEISASTRALAAKFTYLVVAGGIGPTHDDVTVAAVAQAVGCPLVSHIDLVTALHHYGGHQFAESCPKLALAPANSTILSTRNGATAIYTKNIFILPGVPTLLQACLPAVLEQMPKQVLHAAKLLLCCDEVTIANILAQVQKMFNDVEIGSYPLSLSQTAKVQISMHSYSLQRLQVCVSALQTALPADVIVG